MAEDKDEWDVADFREFQKQLEDEIVKGAGTPLEVTQGSDTGAFRMGRLYRKNIAKGAEVRYPPGKTGGRDNEEIAKEIANFRGGNSIFLLENSVGQDDDDFTPPVIVSAG